MWTFWGRTKTEEIRADTGPAEADHTENTGGIGVTPLIDSIDLFRALYISNKKIKRDEAMQIPAIKGSIRILAETVARLPIKLYEKQKSGKIREIKEDHRLRILNDDTGDTLTTSQFWRAILEDYYVGRGGYAYLNRIGGQIESLHYVENSHISIVKSTDPIFKDFRLLVDGKPYDPWDFLILLRNSKDGSESRSIQEESNIILAAAYYSIQFEARNTQKGGAKKGFIESERPLTNDQITELKARWKAIFDDNLENMMVLNKGLKYQDIQNNAREMQLNELRETNLKEASMLIGVPGNILLGSATAYDYEMLVKHGLTPLLVDIEASIDRSFLSESEKENRYFAFDTRELTRGSIRERYEAYEIASRNNFMQTDEIRELEDLEPLGVNYIQLGLDSVLMDPKTKKIYTPNTGQTHDMEGKEIDNEGRTESGRPPSDGVRERTGEREPPGNNPTGESD